MNWSELSDLYAKALDTGGVVFYPSTVHHVPVGSINVQTISLAIFNISVV